MSKRISSFREELLSIRPEVCVERALLTTSSLLSAGIFSLWQDFAGWVLFLQEEFATAKTSLWLLTAVRKKL